MIVAPPAKRFLTVASATHQHTWLRGLLWLSSRAIGWRGWSLRSVGASLLAHPIIREQARSHGNLHLTPFIRRFAREEARGRRCSHEAGGGGTSVLTPARRMAARSSSVPRTLLSSYSIGFATDSPTAFKPAKWITARIGWSAKIRPGSAASRISQWMNCGRLPQSISDLSRTFAPSPRPPVSGGEGEPPHRGAGEHTRAGVRARFYRKEVALPV